MWVPICCFYINTSTGWRWLIGSSKLQIIFHKRATKYRSLLRKVTYKDKGSYESSQPCIHMLLLYKYEYPYVALIWIWISICDMNMSIHPLLSAHTYHIDISIPDVQHSYSYVMNMSIHLLLSVHMCHIDMGWLRLVGSLELKVSFSKEPYKKDDILQKRPIILRSLLVVATPYEHPYGAKIYMSICVYVYTPYIHMEYIDISISSMIYMSLSVCI